jgi:hypothetical protein
MKLSRLLFIFAVSVLAVSVLLILTFLGDKYVRNAGPDYYIGKPPKILSTQLITKHFNILTNADFDTLDYYEKFFEGFFDYFETEYFTIGQNRQLDVYLFKDTKSYKRWTKRMGGPDTEFGFYMGSEENIIVVNRRSGLGTITHELVHHFIDTSFVKPPPPWANEGIATFFEKFIGRLDADGKLTISFGYFSNWRFPLTKTNIDEFDLGELLTTRAPHQGAARSLMLFLHKKGLFKTFVKQLSVQPNDPTGILTLRRVYGKPLAQIDREWRAWVKSQPIDENVKLLPRAFVKTDEEWQKWWNANKDSLYWSETEQIYRVRD